jgi:hypothetical protein
MRHTKLHQGSHPQATTAVFGIVDRVGSVGLVIAPRSHTGEALSVYLRDADIEKVIEFLTWKGD